MTVEALTDGLYVSPAVETADYHASLNKHSWFYVFDYQSKFGDYPQVVADFHAIKLWDFLPNICLFQIEISQNFVGKVRSYRYTIYKFHDVHLKSIKFVVYRHLFRLIFFHHLQLMNYNLHKFLTNYTFLRHKI